MTRKITSEIERSATFMDWVAVMKFKTMTINSEGLLWLSMKITIFLLRVWHELILVVMKIICAGRAFTKVTRFLWKHTGMHAHMGLVGMYSGCDYLLSLKILFVCFLVLPSLLHPSILFNCFYTCIYTSTCMFDVTIEAAQSWDNVTKHYQQHACTIQVPVSAMRMRRWKQHWTMLSWCSHNPHCRPRAA